MICTKCKQDKDSGSFGTKLSRGVRRPSRWCKSCVKLYQHEYYNLMRRTHAATRNRSKLTYEERKAIVASRTKALALAIEYNVSLSCIYRLRQAAQKRRSR